MTTKEIWFTALQKYESQTLKTMHCLIIFEIELTALRCGNDFFVIGEIFWFAEIGIAGTEIFLG